jgi:glycosyltransferase involved in cell wall biosynthesis
LVYDIYDFYSDTRELGILKPIIKKLELWVVKQANLVIIADERRITQLGVLSDKIIKKIITIYNTPEDINLINTYDNSTEFLISYVGVLIPNRNLIEVAEIVKNEKQINIVFAGYGQLEQQITMLSKQTSNVSYLGKVSYDNALNIGQHSTAILAMYDPVVTNNKYAAPNKLCEAMMLGKPIITSDGTLCADIVKKEGIGFVISHNDTEAIKEVFLQIKNNKQLIAEMGKKSRNLYDNKYSALKMKIRLQNAYAILLKQE